MDPNMTYRAFLAALCDGDAEGARDMLTAMRGWLDRGGFVPAGFRTREDVLSRMTWELRVGC